MNISKNVIRDLLPVYVAGEASAETQALVDVALAEDEELRAEVGGLAAVPSLPEPGMPPDIGVAALKHTQRLLRQRTFLIGFSYFFTMLTFAFVQRPGGIPTKLAATVCIAIGIVGWVRFLRNAIRLRDTGLQPRASLWPQLWWQLGAACIVTACGMVLYEWTHWYFLDRHSALVVPLAIALGYSGQRLKQYRAPEAVPAVETLLTLAKDRDREEEE